MPLLKTQHLSDFVFEKNVEKYKPDIVTRFEYKKQRKEHTQYITKIHVLGRTEIYLVVTEVNMPLTILDYMALENAVITLQYSKKIIDYMDMLRYLYGDKNISVADFSKLGFFQIFEKIKNRDELMEYVPESLVKLYWYDKEHDGELIETLQAYLDCDKSANKAAEKLYVNYRTLSGRLKKIKDISGIDFKNSAEMLAVRNGIVLFKMAETL